MCFSLASVILSVKLQRDRFTKWIALRIEKSLCPAIKKCINMRGQFTTPASQTWLLSCFVAPVTFPTDGCHKQQGTNGEKKSGRYEIGHSLDKETQNTKWHIHRGNQWQVNAAHNKPSPAIIATLCDSQQNIQMLYFSISPCCYRTSAIKTVQSSPAILVVILVVTGGPKPLFVEALRVKK